jgi:hypothetical protein
LKKQSIDNKAKAAAAWTQPALSKKVHSGHGRQRNRACVF